MKILLLFTLICVGVVYSSPDSFTEELLMKPLFNHHVYAHFLFSTKWDVDIATEKFHHTRLFPRALGEIIERHNVQELHLSLTAGLWRYERWGYPITNAAPGAELWAWFKPDTKDVDKNWKELASSLSGLICASLNFIDAPNSISPEYSFRPSGVVSESFVNSSYLRYSSLPREVVCTENLTPWKKLLPCESRKGLASLLKSGKIHDTRYHSLAIHLRPVCRTEDCKSTSLEVQQSIALVYDYGLRGRNWTFRQLFAQGLFGSCPLANLSTIYVDVSNNASVPYTLTPDPDEYVTSFRGGQNMKYAKYNVPSGPLHISAVPFDTDTMQINSFPLLHANQYLTGYGQEQGGIVINVFNNYRQELDIVVLQNLPWYILIYLHTLKIKSNGKDIEPLIQKYVPGKLRQRPYYLELVVRLPPYSTTSISIEFEHVFLKWTEYPPDASHGFYIGSAVISCMLPVARNFTGLPQDGLTFADSFNASRSGYLVQIRTEIMVITLPTPDFSMPYNVICLACTVVALAFGPLHNITTKRLILRPHSNEKLIIRMKNKFLEIFHVDTPNENKNKPTKESAAK